MTWEKLLVMTMQSHSRDLTISRDELAQGRGWSVIDATFRADSPRSCFEGRHDRVTIVAVTAGSFRYRSARGSVTLMPGALMLGNAGDAFECRYEGSSGDRCISFSYTPDYFARIGTGKANRKSFPMHRLAPTPAVIALTAGLEGERGRADAARWEELAVRVAGDALAAVDEIEAPSSARDERRVTGALALIEARYAEPLTLGALADTARMSPYHFLRMFRAVAGVTPHQYLMRTRLRHAAVALSTGDRPITEIAFAHGFGDLSNFVTAFGKLFGASPGAYRRAIQTDARRCA